MSKGNSALNNTLLGMELFKDELKSSLIFHIPHSKTEIPPQYQSEYTDNDLLEREISLLTDFATDRIFDIADTTKLIFPYSRVFCDVERLDDANEVMFSVGRGFYYTKTDDGKLLRENLYGFKEIIYNEYYTAHHEELTRIVDDKISGINPAIIIDCHSFSDLPFKTDIEQSANRPDFCLGTDKFHTPKWLTDSLFKFLTKEGYSVEINYPYRGTIVPMKHYQKNKEVLSIMVEVNRKLYMKEGLIKEEEVLKLNQMFSKLFLEFLF
jgi:N-formylglutamate deformylase